MCQVRLEVVSTDLLISAIEELAIFSRYSIASYNNILFDNFRKIKKYIDKKEEEFCV
jgi:hypothetical protein